MNGGGAHGRRKENQTFYHLFLGKIRSEDEVSPSYVLIKIA